MESKLIKYEEFLKFKNNYPDNEVDKFFDNLKNYIPDHIKKESEDIVFELKLEEKYSIENMHRKYRVVISKGSKKVKDYYYLHGPVNIYVTMT